MRIVCLILVIAVSTALSKTRLVPAGQRHGESSRIMYGTLAESGQFPWAVVIEFSTPPSRPANCGGALISSCYVLTAAHCVLNGYYNYKLTLGTTYAGDTSDDVVLSFDNEIIPHQNFDPYTLINDIGVIRLGQCVTFTDKIQPIRMADTHTAHDVSVIACGWGRTETSPGSVRTLFYTHLTTVTNDYCQYKYDQTSMHIPDEFLCCVGADKESPCSGDSGGPLVQQQSDGSYVHVGVISFVADRTTCDELYPSGYMRTASYRSWIYNHTGL